MSVPEPSSNESKNESLPSYLTPENLKHAAETLEQHVTWTGGVEATLRFQLPERNQELLNALNGGECLRVLQEFEDSLRGIEVDMRMETLTADQKIVIEAVRGLWDRVTRYIPFDEDINE